MSAVEHLTHSPAGGAAGIAVGRGRARAAAIAGGVAGALAIWFVAEVVFGLDLRRPAASVGGATADIDAVHVAFAAVVGPLMGWALLAMLERLTSRAGRVWAIVAGLALLVSLGGPLSGSGISAANRLVLVLMHVVVAALVVPALYRTSRAVRGPEVAS